MIRYLTAAALCASPIAIAHAQTVPAPVAIQPVAPQPSELQPIAIQPVAALAPAANGQAVLRAGTEISLAMAEEVTTKKKVAKVGQRFQLTVTAPVEVNGVTVIPTGSPAWGEITSVRNKGMWGKSGKLEAKLLFVRVNGRQIRLTGTFDDKGVTGTAGVVGAIAFVPVAGFFVTGTSATLPMNGPVKGFIDEDVPLAMQAAAVAPLEVPAAQPMVVAAPVAVEAASEADAGGE
ncbi:hypothetical protein [Flavisphingopyxis soli]